MGGRTFSKVVGQKSSSASYVPNPFVTTERSMPDDFTAAWAVPSPRGGFGGLILQTKLQVPQNWNLKHYKLVEFLSNLNVKTRCKNAKPPLTNVKPPYWRLSGDGSGPGSTLASVLLWEEPPNHQPRKCVVSPVYIL